VDDKYAPDDDANMNEVLDHRMVVVVVPLTLDLDSDMALEVEKELLEILMVASLKEKAMAVRTYQVHR
jgi:hypothetical protein